MKKAQQEQNETYGGGGGVAPSQIHGGKFRLRNFAEPHVLIGSRPCQSPQCALLVCEQFAENPEFHVGNFAVNLKREISHAKLKCHEIPPPLYVCSAASDKRPVTHSHDSGHPHAAAKGGAGGGGGGGCMKSGGRSSAVPLGRAAVCLSTPGHRNTPPPPNHHSTAAFEGGEACHTPLVRGGTHKTPAKVMSPHPTVKAERCAAEGTGGGGGRAGMY